MVRGLYTSALGMITQMKKMDVVTNNIANVNTTGFKKDKTVTRAFSEELMLRLNDNSDGMPWDRQIGNVSQGVFVDDVYTDFSGGALHQTGGALDMALSGNGFFSIRVTGNDGQDSVMYTRDGSFTMGSDGTLLTKEGSRVLAAGGGDIKLPPGDITVDENGRIYSNDGYVNTLGMVDFDDYHTLRKVGDNLYTTTQDTNQVAFNGSIVQGYFEASNVNSVKEMVDMITVNRAYEINQRMITIHDTTLGRAVTDIGRK